MISDATLQEAIKTLSDLLSDEVNPRVPKAGRLTWEVIATELDVEYVDDNAVTFAITCAMGFDNDTPLDTVITNADLARAIISLKASLHRAFSFSNHFFTEAILAECDQMIHLATIAGQEEVIREWQATRTLFERIHALLKGAA